MRYIYSFVLILCCGMAVGQSVVVRDSVARTVVYDEAAGTEGGVSSDSVVKKDNFVVKFIKQLLMSNEDKTFEKAFDVSYAVYPTYSNESSFGLGGMVTGLYRLDKRDSLLLPSDVKLLAGVSLTGQYNISVTGNNFFDDRQIIKYKFEFYNEPLDFWGISYDACSVNPKSTYTRQGLTLEADYTYMIYPNIHLGCAVDIRYCYLPKIADVAYLMGEKTGYFFTGGGIVFTYDTRNSINNPSSGVHVLLKEIVYPRPLGTAGTNIYSTTLIANYYQKMWKGSVLALDVYGEYNGKNVPWPLRPEIGEGNSRMRGFYRGRYIDNNMISAQAEVRQHIYKRLGAVVWVGCGSVFSSFDTLRSSDFLLNYGLGIRFELKHDINFRIDYGFGKDMGGLIFTLSEAF